MTHGTFAWADLSALTLERAKGFYGPLFGWSYQQVTQLDGSPYWLASTDRGPAAGLFDMPEMFRKLKLPSYWMPYFWVMSADKACEQGRRLGGKVEMGPLGDPKTGRIALIRDPLGAGFTAVEGPPEMFGAGAPGIGQPVWCALHVSDASAVRGFYETLFGWRFRAAPWSAGAYRTETAERREVVDLVELSDADRGRYQFWGLHFRVQNAQQSQRLATSLGGSLVHADQVDGDPLLLMQDPDGAAFFLRGHD
ncbi:MAG: VOC family protein [Rhodospirillaceae bacterium]